MSVIYAPKNNNGFGGILGTLATLASATIPGMQWLAPAVAAGTGVSRLANGDTSGGLRSLAGAATGLIKTPAAAGKTAAAATPAATVSPDLTDRLQANKELLGQQQLGNKYAQLVSMYGNSPQNDLTARMQMNKNGGVEDMSRYAALMARFPQLFQGR